MRCSVLSVVQSQLLSDAISESIVILLHMFQKLGQIITFECVLRDIVPNIFGFITRNLIVGGPQSKNQVIRGSDVSAGRCPAYD
jgi:hypothetical protein